MIDVSIFSIRYSVAGTCLNLTFSNKFLIDSCCSVNLLKSVSLISYYGFKCLWRSLISTDESDCVAKFRFASALRFYGWITYGGCFADFKIDRKSQWSFNSLELMLEPRQGTKLETFFPSCSRFFQEGKW